MNQRIVVDPEALRLVASRIRGGAESLSAAGRGLIGRHLPAMPAALASIVIEALGHANRELQDLSAALVREAGLLSARATWVELGGGEAGWPRASSFGDAWLGDPGPSGDERSERVEGWSVEVLERAEEPIGAAGDEDAARLREMVEAAPGPAESPNGAGWRDVTFAEADPGDAVLASHTSPRAAGGALLGNVLSETEAGPTGAGILGCIAVGFGSHEVGP